MDDASFILSNLEQIAARTVERQYFESRGFWERFGEEGKRKALADATHHLRFLAEALKTGEPSLFNQYASWLKALFLGLSFPPDTLETTLRVLRETLSEVLPSGKSAQALSFIDTALMFAQEISPEPPSYLTGETPLDKLARQYLSHLLEGQKDSAFLLIQDAFKEGIPL